MAIASDILRRTSLDAFTRLLTTQLLNAEPSLSPHPDKPDKVVAQRTDGSQVNMDMHPIELRPQPATAGSYFREVKDTHELLSSYKRACMALPLEWSDSQAMAHVDTYALHFRDRLLSKAQEELNETASRRIAGWLSQLDIYAAVKAFESLVNRHADRALLEVAAEQDWIVHLDHLAIRCGCEERGDAQRVVKLLCDHHGYVQAQVESEIHYRFADGWDAYPLYKLLDNGRVIRLFIDESSTGSPLQIIQHWNRVYGYTAHHLALRACEATTKGLRSIPLARLTSTLNQAGVETMTPTGGYTTGLLEQVFTRPTRTPDLPPPIISGLAQLDPDLPSRVENGKLIELVARREMPQQAAERLFDLYGLDYQPGNPDHSAPIYPYFLPAQAAHVIRTSVETA